MQASSQLTSLLKISSVAGVFISIILGMVSAVWIMLGVAQVEILILMWGTLFLGLPMFGILYLAVKVREYLRDILGALEKS
ncbi:MAG: hypothetical protein VCD50_01650 [Alphaproteobacteria bacterium]|jgi:ABC-type arginine transport system permease subunit